MTPLATAPAPAAIAPNLLEAGGSEEIQYSFCNEDTRSELTALSVTGAEVVAIAAGGGRAFGLLLGDPARVRAVDSNPAQIQLCRLKHAAIGMLTREEYLAFEGLTPSQDRRRTYERLRAHLPENTRSFWDQRVNAIDAGLMRLGAYDRAVAKLATLISCFKGDALAQMAACVNPDEQRPHVNSRWSWLTWRVLLTSIFQPWVGRFVIRDPSFYGPFRTRSGAFLHDRLVEYLTRHHISESYMLQLFSIGRIPEGTPLPEHLMPGRYETVASRLDRLEFVRADLGDHLAHQRAASIDAFSLSDLGSYADAASLERVLAQVVRCAHAGARVCLREFLCQPRLSISWPARLERNTALETRLAEHDSAVGYTFVCASLRA